MTRKVIITDADSGKQLRETYVHDEPKFFGMGIRDVVWGILLTVAIITFFTNSDANQKTMQATLNRLVDFRDNSDSWNTYAFGTRFKDGQPLDRNFIVKNYGNVNGKPGS